MIDPDAIPQFTGHVDQLESDISDLKGDGAAIAKTGADTHSAFQGLSAYYQAPEAEQLFATTKPVATAGTTFQDDLTRVTGALSSYATEIRPIATQLYDLKKQAHAFVTSVAHDHNWQYDAHKVNRDNHLRSEVDAAVAAFWDAERRCANAIEAVFGGTRFTANDGTNKPTMYGYTAKQLDGAKDLPWGDPVEQKYHWYNIGHWTWSFIKGFCVDGVWGTIKGIGGLVGFEGWDTLVNSWKGLGELGIGLTAWEVAGPAAFMVPRKDLPGWLADSLETTKAAGKAMIGWDEWSKDPARAAGGVVFNVLTVIAGGGEADGAEAAGDAGKASMAARAMGALSKAGRFVDPMTYVGKGAGFAFGNLAKIPKVSVALDGLSKAKAVSVAKLGDHLTNLRAHLPGGTDLRVPSDDLHIPSDHLVAGPDGTIHLPDGSRLTPDGHYHLPDGTTATVPSDDLAHGLHASSEDPTHVPTDPAHELIGAHAGPGGHSHTAGGASDHTPRGELGTRAVPGPGAGEHVPGGHTGAVNAPGHHLPGDGGGGHVPGHGAGPHPGLGDVGGIGHDGLDHGSGLGDDTSHGTHHVDDAARHHAEYEAARKKPADQRTAEERAAITREHVRLANEDPAWRAEHYDKIGRRLDSLEKVDGQILPVLAEKPSGGWMNAHHMPYADGEKYRLETLGRDRSTVHPHDVSHLDDVSAKRAAGMKLTAAEKAYEANPTTGLEKALEAAQQHFDHTVGAHVSNNSKLGEALGEEAARRHMLLQPEFKGAKEITDLPETANGSKRFDQLWRDKDGHLIIVEAKGPNARLDWRQGNGARDEGTLVKQGTVEYVRTIVADMEDRAGTSANDAKYAREIRKALKSNTLQYVLVQTAENDGKYAGAGLKYFKIF